MAGEKGREGSRHLSAGEIDVLEILVHWAFLKAGAWDPMTAIQSGQMSLADAIRRGHHDIVGQYLGATMSPNSAANTYRDLVSGVAGWY